MSIISQTQTHDQEIEAKVALIIRKNGKLYSNIHARLQSQYNLLWALPTIDEDGNEVPPAVTPQEIMDKLGTQAYKLFESALGLQTQMAAVDPDYVQINVPYNYKINQDGTVTVGALKERQ